MTESSQDVDIIGFLFVMEGNDKGEIIKLFSGRNTLGTSLECSIILNDPGVSAKHASIRYGEDEEYVIRDLDSKNGTFVNGEEVITGKLQENDVILIGDSKLKFKML
jgi:pSer/pThr/pTyr-binding forkhead associated (FHA) protein